MEWGQGLQPLDKALGNVAKAFGADFGSLARLRFKTLGVRVLGTARARHVGQPSMKPLLGYIAGEDAGQLKTGVPALLSQLEETCVARNPAAHQLLRKHRIAEVGLVCLARDAHQADYLEFYFSRSPAADWDRQLAWGASALARAYDMRRPGFVTEALAQNADRSEFYNGSDAPILSTANPAGLTKSEWKIAILVSRGLTPKAVAAEQGVSIATVRTHLRNIYAKTGLDGYHRLARRLISAEEQQAFRDPTRMVA